jgi:hypothetical protein
MKGIVMSHDPAPVDELALLRSRYIAGLIGPVLVAIGASLLFNHGLLEEIAAEVARDKAGTFLTGLLLLCAGLAIVQLHETLQGWPAVITVIGWLTVLSGLARILFPFQLAELAPQIIKSPAPLFGAAACLAVGAFLSAKAYL